MPASYIHPAQPQRRRLHLFSGLIATGLLLAVCQGRGEPPDKEAAKAGAPGASAPGAQPSAKPDQSAPYRRGKPERVPFLGVIAVQSAPQQRIEAALPEGIGLTVLYVVRESPAQAAGIQRFDVLHKFNDQLLVNEAQFRVLIRACKPGDTVDLTLFRKTKPLKVSVRLMEKEVAVVQGTPAGMMLWTIDAAKPGAAKSSRTGFSARYEDDAHVLELKTDEQGKHLVAKDKGGSILFQGPVNTPDQRKAVPAALLPKLERLENPPPPEVRAAPAPSQPTPDLS